MGEYGDGKLSDSLLSTTNTYYCTPYYWSLGQRRVVVPLALYAGPLQEEAYILKNNFLTFNHYDVAYLSGKTDFDSYIKCTKFMVSLV